jgi:hypothetical protein
VFARTPVPRASQGVVLAACALAGALGLLPGAAGALDPVTELAWLVLLAPAAGVLCGAAGPALVPFAAMVPGAWCFALVWADASSERDLPTPIWAALAVAGFFTGGFALGCWRPERSIAHAGALLLAFLGATGLSLSTGATGAGEGNLARSHPRLAALALDVSPLAFAYDCAGWDWPHANPDVYARSGVEWFQRRPWRGSLAGPGVLVVGCALAWLARARSPMRPRV